MSFDRTLRPAVRRIAQSDDRHVSRSPQAPTSAPSAHAATASPAVLPRLEHGDSAEHGTHLPCQPRRSGESPLGRPRAGGVPYGPCARAPSRGVSAGSTSPRLELPSPRLPSGAGWRVLDGAVLRGLHHRARGMLTWCRSRRWGPRHLSVIPRRTSVARRTRSFCPASTKGCVRVLTRWAGPAGMLYLIHSVSPRAAAFYPKGIVPWPSITVSRRLVRAVRWFRRPRLSEPRRARRLALPAWP